MTLYLPSHLRCFAQCIAPPRENEEQIGQTIEIDNRLVADLFALAEQDDKALSPPTYRP